ncbi:hypothetical protein [Breznakia pachnodae]|uniref:Uncharacterized protein n=1 Tax=Breznakia pachnodae TaxID=265178 RepID=A0ABU0DZH4_9FIRM|nr:hypothetical protein [Breznakia pachnodae]MDQ0359981.1 hypothetical protein [Breznakia pachnodae]
MSGQLGSWKTVQKSCRFTSEEVEFIQSNFGSYYNNSFNNCLSNMIYRFYYHKEEMDKEVSSTKKELEELKKEIVKYKEILSNLKRIENSVNSALYCAKDLDNVLQKNEKD